jgi:hypothetical protein
VKRQDRVQPRALFAQTLERFRFHPVHKIDFIAAESDQFRVAITLNLEPDRLRIRQPPSVLVGFPVIRVAPEQDE